MKAPYSRFGFWGAGIIAWATSTAHLSAQAVIAGVDPVTDVGGPDGWTNILYINESDPFDFTGTGHAEGAAYEFRFWADVISGTVTPFVAEVVAPNVFIVRAIGTTRRGGQDWIDAGLRTFPFKDGATPIVQHGWAAGFISSTPEGDEGGSPIPFTNSNVEGWLTGASAMGSGVPNIVEGQPPTMGGSGTDDNAYGKRRYAFQIRATLTVPLAPTDIIATPSAFRTGLAVGTTVATLSAVDRNALDSHTFTLVAGEGATDNAKFSITDSALKTALPVVGEGNYSIRVRARDSASLTFDKVLVFSALADRPPTAIHLVPASILSALPIGSTVGLLSSDDLNNVQGDSHGYDLVVGDGSADNALFSIEENRLILQVDPEPGRTYRIRVRSTDSTGLAGTEALALPVILVLGNTLSPRGAATDGSAVPIFYTTGVAVPKAGTVNAVTIPLQSAGQLNLVFRMFQLRPTANEEEFDVISDSGAITVTGLVGAVATFPFPNGGVAVQAGDLFYHYGRGIPFDANQGNLGPIWWPSPTPPVIGQPLNLALGNPDFPLREEFQRDYAWVVHFNPESVAGLRIVDVAFNVETKMITLTWTSQPNQTYSIKASAALVSWNQEILGGIPGAAGATTSRTFGPVAVPGASFYRIEKSP